MTRASICLLAVLLAIGVASQGSGSRGWRLRAATMTGEVNVGKRLSRDEASKVLDELMTARSLPDHQIPAHDLVWAIAEVVADAPGRDDDVWARIAAAFDAIYNPPPPPLPDIRTRRALLQVALEEAREACQRKPDAQTVAAFKARIAQFDPALKGLPDERIATALRDTHAVAGPASKLAIDARALGEQPQDDGGGSTPEARKRERDASVGVMKKYEGDLRKYNKEREAERAELQRVEERLQKTRGIEDRIAALCEERLAAETWLNFQRMAQDQKGMEETWQEIKRLTAETEALDAEIARLLHEELSPKQ
jgi:hypothetical protein